MTGHYREDLAYVHDVGFGRFSREAAPGLLALLARSGIRSGRVVDLGCGTGLWARELARSGSDVVGIDRSAAMIAISGRRLPRATFRRGSFLDTRLPASDAVTALGEVLGYLADGRVGLPALGRLFGRVFRALRPGGLFIFDLAEPGRAAAGGPEERAFEGPDWAVITSAEEDSRARVLTRRITVFRKVDGSYRRSREVHRLRLFRAPEITTRLRAVGFRVRVVRGYGSLRFPRGVAGFVARKP